MPYDEYRPVPAGYHVEERPRYAMALTGGVLFATGATMLTYGYFEHRGGAALMTGGVIVAVIGAPLLVVGIASKRKVVVADDVAVAPIATPTFGGIAIAATF